jgi:hypothetical protein
LQEGASDSAALLFRLCLGSIKALLRLYEGAIKALSGVPLTLPLYFILKEYVAVA